MIEEPQRFTHGSAACTLYRDAPSWNGARTAAVGQFHCGDSDDGAALLETVARTLAQEGFAALIGPMNGDTWHSYRLVEETDGSPAFLMEPKSGPLDRDAFVRASFKPISRYASSRTTLAAAIGEDAPFIADDLVIRAWDGRNADAFIDRLFEMSSAQFANNAFFKPITQDAFLALYRPVMAAIDPRLVLFAFDTAGNLAGFLFGLPDHLEGAKPTTAILKTYASHRRGAGRALADAFHRTARDIGFTQVIHALMHETNVSLARSAQHQAHVFRRYALMGRSLTGAT